MDNFTELKAVDALEVNKVCDAFSRKLEYEPRCYITSIVNGLEIQRQTWDNLHDALLHAHDLTTVNNEMKSRFDCLLVSADYGVPIAVAIVFMGTVFVPNRFAIDRFGSPDTAARPE
jgi:hypothetical protein